MLFIKTERLRFERYEESDIDFVLSMVEDPETMQFIGDGLPKDQKYAAHLIKRMQEQYRNFDDYGLHKLVHNETNEIIGHAGLVAQVIDGVFEMELGYWIHRNYWQQGYGFEAAEALKNYADQELYLERYISAIQLGNIGSQRIAIKNGMELEKIIEMDGKQVAIYVKLHEID